VTTVDDLVHAIYERLCLRQRHQGAGADMSFFEVRVALGITEAQLAEAIKVLRFSEDLKIVFTAAGRVKLGTTWRARCEEGSR